jgi:hypothetical protein
VVRRAGREPNFSSEIAWIGVAWWKKETKSASS